MSKKKKKNGKAASVKRRPHLDEKKIAQILTLKKTKKLTQSEIAARVGCSQSTVCRVVSA